MEKNEKNIIEQLMAYDAGDLVRPTKDVTIKLLKFGGKPFTFPITSLDTKVASAIQQDMYDLQIKKGGMDMRLLLAPARLKTIEHGCPEVFRSKELQEHFGAKSAHELINMLLELGEQDYLKGEIDALTGFTSEETAAEEVKN